MDSNIIFIKVINKIIFLIIVECINTIHISSTVTNYHSEEFGYFVIDDEKESINIFKYNSNEKNGVTNVANCSITGFIGDYCFYISSTQPYNIKDLNLNIISEEQSNPDSIRVSITLPKQIKNGYQICIEPAVGKKTIYSLSNKNKVSFNLPKYPFEYDNFFSLIILPVVDPFGYHSSWGDNETLSFLDLEIEKHIDICNPQLSNLEIIINNFSDDIFTKWIIVNDYVTKIDNQIIWKGITFTEIN